MPSDKLTAEIEKAVENVSFENQGIASDPEERAPDEQVVGGEFDEQLAKPDEDSEEDSTTSEAESIEDDSQESESESEVGQDGEQDDEQEDESEAEESDSDDAPELSDEIIARALNAGMDLKDALAFPSEQSLDRIVSAMERGRQPARQEPEKKEALKEKEDPFADLDLDPEKYDPEVVELFGKVKKVLAGQYGKIKEFEQQQEQTSRNAEMAAAQEVERWFDGQVKELGEDFADALGSGGYRSLDRGSSQFANREAIANQMAVMMAGYQAMGQEAPPREQVFDAAARLVLRDKYQQVGQERLAGKLAKRALKHVQRVAGPKAKSKSTPEEEAADALKAKFGV